MIDGARAIVPPTDRTLGDQVVRQLRKQIILGHLKPGERLAEVRLAGQLEVSRSTVREALRRLAAEGLVEISSHRGSRVAQLEPTDAFQICELHALLEEHCVRHLELPINDSLRKELDQLVQEMCTLEFPGDVDRFIDLDHAFHRSLVVATGQRRVLQVWSGLGSLLGVLVALSLRHLRIEGARTAERHHAIIDALSQPDAERAAGTVGAHYRSLKEQLMEVVVMSQSAQERTAEV